MVVASYDFEPEPALHLSLTNDVHHTDGYRFQTCRTCTLDISGSTFLLYNTEPVHRIMPSSLAATSSHRLGAESSIL